MPAGWVHSRLDDSALLLVDGVDELAPRQRQKVRRGLCDLHNSHPELPILVTSRPSAAASRGAPTSGSNRCCWSRWTIRCHRILRQMARRRPGRRPPIPTGTPLRNNPGLGRRTAARYFNDTYADTLHDTVVWPAPVVTFTPQTDEATEVIFTNVRAGISAR
jgi:hypothetical protein